LFDRDRVLGLRRRPGSWQRRRRRRRTWRWDESRRWCEFRRRRRTIAVDEPTCVASGFETFIAAGSTDIAACLETFIASLHGHTHNGQAVHSAATIDGTPVYGPTQYWPAGHGRRAAWCRSNCRRGPATEPRSVG
jgi:hypothetical protein